MRVVAILVVVLGVALAGGAVYYGQQIQQANALRIEPQTIRVLAAKQVLNQGDRLGTEHLQWIEWPSHVVPDGVFTSIKAVFGSENDQRRYVMRRIEPGEPILDAKLSRPNEPGRISYDLPPGMRAASIRIGAVSGVAGFIAAGDHVDILLTRKDGALVVSSVILQDISVLAIDQTDDVETSAPKVGRTATVAVTVHDAQKLSVAQRIGKLSLTLRPRDAHAAEEIAPLDSRVLDVLPAPAAAPKKQVIVRRGIVTEAVTVE